MPSATSDLPSPWKEFLSEVDQLLPEPVELHCVGGFVLTLLYSLKRPTSDVDYIEIVPPAAARTIQEIAGKGSELDKKFGLHFQYAAVTSLPEGYPDRLVELFPDRFRNLRLRAVEPHDLALSKLARNSDVDREDVRYLAKMVPLDQHVLRSRYYEELRPGPLIGPPERHDLTLQMWIDAFFPKQEPN